ncbi:hypothetical protein WN982_23120 [Paraburkholderia sp. IMGN_8]|uniref:hypothetical protein n=1 Tax=Paraburkholderia sp. IMGN_8 TaxID=3136564 RepID=UPI0031017D93
MQRRASCARAELDAAGAWNAITLVRFQRIFDLRTVPRGANFRRLPESSSTVTDRELLRLLCIRHPPWKQGNPEKSRSSFCRQTINSKAALGGGN